MDLITLFKLILSLSLMGSIVAGIIIIFKALLGDKFGAKWQYYIWVLLVIRLVVPFTPQTSFNIPDLFANTSSNDAVTQEIAQNTVVNTTQQKVEGIAPTHKETNKTSGSMEQIPDATNVVATKTAAETVVKQIKSIMFDYKTLSLIWLAGVLVILLYILILNMRFNKRVSNMVQGKDSEANRILEECKLEMGIHTNIPIIYDTSAKTPFLFGLIRPKLITSFEVVSKLSPEEIRYVFLHELTHLKRKDIFINWIIVFLQAMNWFNPVIWYSFHRMKQDCEVACDAAVLEHINPKEHNMYGQTIINLLSLFSQSHAIPGTTGIVGKSQAKKRIAMISIFRKKSFAWSAVAIISAILIAGISMQVGCSLSDKQKSANSDNAVEQQTKDSDNDQKIDDNLVKKDFSLDKESWEKLNIFFSNFSEAKLPFFQKGKLPDDELIAFGIRHNILNNPETLEKIDHKEYNERISEENVKKSVEKYFGESYSKNKSIKAYSIEFSNGKKEEGFYLYSGNYYLIPINNNYQIDPARIPNGELVKFSQVTGMQENGNDLYTVFVNIYSLHGDDNNFQGKMYSEKPEEWAKKNTTQDLPILFTNAKATIRKMNDGRYILIDYVDIGKEAMQLSDIKDSKQDKDYSPNSVVVATKTTQSDTVSNNINKYIGVYKYQDKNNSNEDQYIVLENLNGKLEGRYYGTSDDFDEAREGYYPGFFVSNMRDLQIKDNTINYNIQLQDSDVFAKPIDLIYKSSKEISLEKNSKWDVRIRRHTCEYNGKIVNGEIQLEVDFGPRVFKKNK